jgi:hypothetical protein
MVQRFAIAALLCSSACTSSRQLRRPLEVEELRQVNEEVRDREVELVLDRQQTRDAHRLLLTLDEATFRDADKGQVQKLRTATVQAVIYQRDGAHWMGLLQGMGLGFVIGAGSGALAGCLGNSGTQGMFGGCGFGAALGAVLGAIVGTPIGLIAGAIHGTHEEIELRPPPFEPAMRSSAKAVAAPSTGRRLR